MKRFFMLVAVVGGVMFADLVGLIIVTRAFLPNKPPMWATAPFFWALAWPVPALSKVFPNPNPLDVGPSFLAVAVSGLLDFALLYALLSFIERRRRARRTATTA